MIKLKTNLLILSIVFLMNNNTKAIVKNQKTNPKAFSIEQVAIADKYYSNKNYKQALKHYTNVVNNPKNADPVSLLLAQANLANMYYNGRGTIRNYKKALKYYTDVANNPESGHQTLSEAHLKLSNMYGLGKGTEQNLEKAVEYAKYVIINPNPNPLTVIGAKRNIEAINNLK